MIDRATVDKIMEAANIVDVVSEFVTLRKSGVNYKGLCPFHDDRNPSFMVSPAKNICHCFVCGKGGTPAGFLMEHEQITYPEALRWLARKYNIEIEERELTEEERREQGERESMFIVNEWAKDFYHDILNNDIDGQAIGKQYFRSRGIRDDIIERFQLGYAPQKRDLLSTAALQKGYQAEYLVKTGLCYEREDRGLIDRFAGRAIFPWFNVSGKVVAFGGRVLDARTKGVAQKYVNSPDSDIYHKERELYGLFQAKRAIVKEDCVYMVEGYTDVIAMHQCGLENVVANSGTALSNYQIHILHRFTQNIVLLYDGDEAGIHAAMRGTDMLLAEGMNIKVLLLPDGDDPDSFSRKHTAQEFKTYIEEHQTDFIQFKTDLMLRGVTDPIKRSEAISSIVRSISVIPDQIVRDTYLHDCASRLAMKEQTLINTMNNYIRADREEKRKEQERANRSNGQPGDPQTAGSTPDSVQVAVSPVAVDLQNSSGSPVEQLIVQCLIRHGEQVIFEGLEADDGSLINMNVAQYIDYDLSQDGLKLSNELYNQILSEAVEQSANPNFKAETYFTQHPDIRISQLATRMAINRYQVGKRFQQPEREGAGNNMERIKELMEQYKQTQQLRNELAKQLGNDVLT